MAVVQNFHYLTTSQNGWRRSSDLAKCMLEQTKEDSNPYLFFSTGFDIYKIPVPLGSVAYSVSPGGPSFDDEELESKVEWIGTVVYKYNAKGKIAGRYGIMRDKEEMQPFINDVHSVLKEVTRK